MKGKAICCLVNKQVYIFNEDKYIRGLNILTNCFIVNLTIYLNCHIKLENSKLN